MLEVAQIDKICQNIAPASRSDFRYLLIALNEYGAFGGTQGEHVANLRKEFGEDVDLEDLEAIRDRLNDLIDSLQEAKLIK